MTQYDVAVVGSGAGGAHVFIPRFNYDRKTDYHGG
jgi:pyruvate/2-oxoglutarate dehydrogenase complex dihydrolipoamide dehydrogenase (E3) component